VGDSCVAINILEEAAASVSEVIQAKEAAQIAPIRDVRRYLFRVFLRKVAAARRNETPFEEISRWYSHPRDDSHGDRLDSEILLDQIFGHFDSVTREMILSRIEGHSWGEIAVEFGLSTMRRGSGSARPSSGCEAQPKRRGMAAPNRPCQ